MQATTLAALNDQNFYTMDQLMRQHRVPFGMPQRSQFSHIEGIGTVVVYHVEKSSQ